jgi:AraC family transcriptional regulator
LAKIAVAVEQALAQRAVNGSAGGLSARVLARGDGWIVEDILCTCGPHDHSFEEQHTQVAIAIVAAGTFQYRTSLRGPGRECGRELMTPGSLLLGNAEHGFECGHAHGMGDRCLAFRYAPAYFERLAADAGVRGAGPLFPVLRIPPIQSLSPLVATAFAGLPRSVGSAGLTGGAGSASSVESPGSAESAETVIGDWEEIAVRLAARTVTLARGLASAPATVPVPPNAVARVTRTVRAIERHPDAALTLARLARDAGLSPYHFLRTFERVTGMTPHRYILRARLREAARRLATEPALVLDIALDCGFGDVSNFNRAFRTEFGVSPRAYRAQAGVPGIGIRRLRPPAPGTCEA